MHHCAARIARRHCVHRLEQQRVVTDDQVGADPHRLVDDRGDRVDGEQDPPHRLVEVTADQPDRVPALGVPRVVELVEDSDDISERALAEIHSGTVRHPRPSGPHRHRHRRPPTFEEAADRTTVLA